jgi:hypothetical protein
MLAVLDNNDRLQCLTDEYFDSCLHTFLQGTAAFFTCSVLQTAEIAQYFKVGNKLSFVSNEVSYHFDITKMNKNEQLVTIQADSLTLELRNEFASEYKASKAMTFKQYLDVFLFAGDNPLVMGINEVSDKSLQAEWTGDGESTLARLFSLSNKFDAEIEFVTVLNKHWGLDKVRLNVYRAHSDKYQGIGKKRTDIIMEYGNNVETIEYEENIDDLKTAIRPMGTDGLTVANVVIDEKDENGNQLFYSPKGDISIRAVQARDGFPSKVGGEGYIAKKWTYETTNANVLAGQALAELKKLCEPKVTVTIKGYEYLGIGDTVLVQNTAYVPTLNLSARISEQEIYFDDPSKNASTFTNVEILKSEVDQSLLDRVNALIEQTKPYTLSLVSDNGVTFKNSEGKTTLSAIVYNGTQVITPDVTVRWYKDDAWVKTGYTLGVQASDITDKAVYRAEVMDTNGVIRAKAEVTVFNVDDGRGIKGKPVLSYASSGSINTVPTTWQATIPSVPAGSYLWTREVTTYSDDTTSEVITPVLQGPNGDPGTDGIAGKDGIGIKSTQIMYAGSDSGTVKPTAGWTSDVPVLAAGKYLWTETTWLYSDNTGESGYSVSRIGKDGNTGADGIAGKDGVGIANTTITYATSTSGTTAPASGYTQSVPSVAEGSFLWTKTVWTYTDGTNETGYSVAKQGARGADGKDGKGIIDSKQEWAASTSGTTAPTVWQATIPTVTAGQYLWSRITETWSDNNKTYKFTIGKIGENGQNAQMMFLSATTNQMMFNADNTPKMAQSSIVTAKYQNVTGTVAFTAKGIKTDGTSETLTLTGSGDSRTITSDMFKTDWVMITVTATLAGLTDTLSIVKVNDGADGAGGKDGYFHSAWAMSADGKTGFSTTTSAGKYYIGTYFDFVKEDSTDPTKYNWVELANAIGMHFAYAWSADGTDRFTTVNPNENLVRNSSNISSFDFWQPYDGMKLGAHSYYKSGTSNLLIMSNNTTNEKYIQSYRMAVKPNTKYTLMFKGFNNSNLVNMDVFFLGSKENIGLTDRAFNFVHQLAGSERLSASTLDSRTYTFTTSSDEISGYIRIDNNGMQNASGATADLYIVEVKLSEYQPNEVYTPSPIDDYDNAIPRCVGRSLKDSSNPSDYTWEVNSDRRPWVGYMQSLDGTDFSKVPYGENIVLGTSSPFTITGNNTNNQGFTLYKFSKPSFKDFGFKEGDLITLRFDWETTANSGSFRPEINNTPWAYGSVLKATGTSGDTYYGTDISSAKKSGTIVINYRITNESAITDTSYPKVRFDNLESGKTFTIKNYKLEEGSVATPWTPNPNDTDADGSNASALLQSIPKYIGYSALPSDNWGDYTWQMNPVWADLNATLGLNTKVDNGQYQEDKSQIFEDIANRLTKEEAAEINTIAQKALDMITAYTDPDSGKAAADLNALEQRIVGMVNELGSKVARWNFIDTWMTAGEEGFSIANAKSTTKFLVKNNRMSFINNGEEVAYFSGQSFMIQRGIVTQGMQIGSHKEEALNKDHTVTRWIAT